MSLFPRYGVAKTPCKRRYCTDICIALVENENTLKRFFIDKERGCVRLHPENPEMKDILVKSCQIQGVAVHVIKSLQ